MRHVVVVDENKDVRWSRFPDVFGCRRGFVARQIAGGGEGASGGGGGGGGVRGYGDILLFSRRVLSGKTVTRLPPVAPPPRPRRSVIGSRCENSDKFTLLHVRTVTAVR